MTTARPLEIIEDRKVEQDIIEGLIRSQAAEDEPVRILEAGCGRHWPFHLDGIRYVLTGVDMDKAALEIRKNNVADLHEAIVGDLCTVDLGSNRYDVIYCSFVLEHVEHADRVVRNFLNWLRPGGIIVIKVPDPYAVHGYFTKLTPHWFHVFYYRRIRGRRNAGKPGFPPYPTYYHPVVSRDGMHAFCDDCHNCVALSAEYGVVYDRSHSGPVKTMLYTFKRVVNVLSAGALSDRHTNLLYVLRKLDS